MTDTVGMLEVRLAMLDRIRRVEHALAREEQVRTAAALLKGRSHELGNMIQIVKLSAFELGRRVKQPEVATLLSDMMTASDAAAKLLTDMFASARPPRRATGPAIAPSVRAAIDQVRAALAGTLELRVELADDIASLTTADELEALVLAAVLDVSGAPLVTLVVRERLIESARWIELVRSTPATEHQRAALADDAERVRAFEPPALLHVVAGVARQAGGAASLSPGRTGVELVIELPIAPSQSSSSS